MPNPPYSIGRCIFSQATKQWPHLPALVPSKGTLFFFFLIYSLKKTTLAYPYVTRPMTGPQHGINGPSTAQGEGVRPWEGSGASTPPFPRKELEE